MDNRMEVDNFKPSIQRGSPNASWRTAACWFLYSPIFVGTLLLFASVLILQLPKYCCTRYRAVGYLPFAGLAYYGFAVPLILIALGWEWWNVLGATALVLLVSSSGWLLPDAFTFLFNPRKRHAVKRAVEHIEASNGPRPDYSMANVIGLEHDRTIVSVVIAGHSKPPRRRFFAVLDDLRAVEELDFEYVSTKHGVRAWR